MMTISNVAQPMHCTTFSPVGRYDARRPSSPRIITIAGARSRAAGAAVSPSSVAPISAPTTIASTVTPSGRPARTTNAAATGSSRLMPRLNHSPKVSRRPSTGGGGSVRVRGASSAGRVGTAVLMSLSLRRHYPVRFERSTARAAVLSARSVPSSRMAARAPYRAPAPSSEARFTGC
jgi:hypothetical protein